MAVVDGTDCARQIDSRGLMDVSRMNVHAMTLPTCMEMMLAKMLAKTLASVFPGLAPKGRRVGNPLMVRNEQRVT